MQNIPDLYLTKEAVRLSSDRELRRQRQRGALVRLGAGVYVSAVDWRSLDADEQFRTRIAASSLRARIRPQFSHDSAAAMWRLPSIGPWPRTVDQLIERAQPTSTRVGVIRHARGRDRDPREVDGVAVTSLARTLVDISCTSTFVRAVAMVDDGLRPTRPGDPRWGWVDSATDQAQLLQLLERLEPYAGSVRARRVLEFASALSGSPGESVARVQFHALGLPSPELQVEFSDEHGLIGFADFYWPDLDLIVEFDGKSKYGAARRYQLGLTPQQLLQQEKAREDRLRRVVTSFTRIDWAKTRDRRILAEHLRRYGLSPRSRALSGETARHLGIV